MYRRKLRPRWLIFMLVLVSLLVGILFATPVRADVAPPAFPPGFNPEPGTEITQVRMMEETVIIDVQAVKPVKAHVTASFVMKNLSDKPESMLVRFPIEAFDGWSWFPEVENFGVKVNNQTVDYERYDTDFNYEEFHISSWARFPVTFPPGENVNLKVSYDLTATPFHYEIDPAVSFSYILSTGAGWKDSIGSATIILRLPYEANIFNMVLEDMQKQPDKIAGREAYWVFENLEPTIEDNLLFPIVKPEIWSQVETYLKKTRENPSDGESWGMLAKAYKSSLIWAKGFCRVGGGADQLFYLSKAAYEKATMLKPNDALWHAGFADLLIRNEDYSGCPDILINRERGLVEIQRALELAPNDPKVLEIAENISWDVPDRLVLRPDGKYLLVTASATKAEPTNTSTLLPVTATSTSKPAETTTPTESPTSTPAILEENTGPDGPNSICCGSIFAVLLSLAVAFWKHVRK